VEAYDSRGRMVRLDPDQAPGVPVLMAGVDRPEAVRAGLETVNQGLRQAGFSSEHRAMDLQDAIPCAKLTSIRIAHGQEPWWRDGLEIYAVVSGVDPVEPKPNLKLVDMPYVRHEATGYAPDHIILFWTDYRFSAANIQFFDHGDGTNYQELLDALLKAVASAMVAGGAPLYAWIPALADAVLEAMPASWRTDSDTWLDTFYTLEKDQTYLDRDGAARAVRISLVPWLLHPSE
jgi:hypothetical protein